MPDVVFTIEMKLDQDRMEQIRSKIGFYGYLVVNTMGRSGGLTLLWKTGEIRAVKKIDEKVIRIKPDQTNVFGLVQ